MALDISRFQALQNTTNRVVLSGQGDQVRVGTSGSVATWFKSHLKPGTFAQENQQVMRAFIQSITDKYGPGMGRVATRQLQKDLDAGLPLTGARIRDTLQTVKQAEVQRNTEMNSATVQRMSKFDANDPHNTLGKVITDTAQEMGMGGRTGELNTQVLSQRIRERLEKATDGNTKVISQEQARQIAKQCVQEGLQSVRNMDRCKELAQQVSMPLDSPKLTAMKKFLDTHHIPQSDQGHLDKLFGMVNELKVKADSDLTALDKMVKEGESFFDTMGRQDVPGHQVSGSTIRMLKAMATATESLGSGSVGVDDHNKTIESMVKVFVDSGKVPQDQALRCFNHLTSESGQKLLGSGLLAYDPNVSGKLKPDQILKLSRVYSLGSTMMMILGKAVGKDQQTCEGLVRGLPQYRGGIRDVDANTLHALRGMDVDLPFGSKVMKGQMSEGFKTEFQALAPGLGPHGKNGIQDNCFKDMSRGTYKLNGQDITRPGGKGRYSAENGAEALRKAIPDENTRKIVTALSHQGLMATFLNTQMIRDDSPLQAILSEVHGPGHELQYNIRTDDPDKIYIDFSYKTKFDHMVNDTGTSKVNPDSHYNVGFTMVVDRKMAQQGIPQVEIQGPMTYDIEVKH